MVPKKTFRRHVLQYKFVEITGKAEKTTGLPGNGGVYQFSLGENLIENVTQVDIFVDWVGKSYGYIRREFVRNGK